MNNPTNPNKLTAIIMIALAFALLFIVGIAVQSYLNGQQALKNGETGVKNTQIIKELIQFQNKTGIETVKILNETNHILKNFSSVLTLHKKQTQQLMDNSKIFRQMLEQLKEINNKTK